MLKGGLYIRIVLDLKMIKCGRVGGWLFGRLLAKVLFLILSFSALSLWKGGIRAGLGLLFLLTILVKSRLSLKLSSGWKRKHQAHRPSLFLSGLILRMLTMS